MTLHHPNHPALHESEPIRPELEPLSNFTEGDSCRNKAWLKPRFARRRGDRFEAGASDARAGVFSGMLMGAGSLALMVWLAALVL